jgi:hypothetical protein
VELYASGASFAVLLNRVLLGLLHQIVKVFFTGLLVVQSTLIASIPWAGGGARPQLSIHDDEEIDSHENCMKVDEECVNYELKQESGSAKFEVRGFLVELARIAVIRRLYVKDWVESLP